MFEQILNEMALPSLSYPQPKLDILESENNLLVTMELPAVKKEDVKIKLENGYLTIRGKKEAVKEKSILRKETFSGEFERVLKLDDSLDVSSTSAELKEGLLRITLNKKEEAKPLEIKIA
jgi:HSP20 family protein